MASIYKIGNSLAAVIPAQAARQLGLQFKTPILIFVSESEIRIRNASSQGTQIKRVREADSMPAANMDDPW